MKPALEVLGHDAMRILERMCKDTETPMPILDADGWRLYPRGNAEESIEEESEVGNLQT